MFRSLSHYNFRLWFIGALVSNIGTWMQSTTQSWVVLTELTDNNALAVGVTMALQFGPQILLVPVTGLVADRRDRRRILILTQSAMAVLGVGLGVLLLSGAAELWHVYMFALVLGIVGAFDAPARQTFVSELVTEHNMSNAVALNSASFNAARLLGPALAGGLIVVISSGWVFVLNAFTFLAVIVALLALRRKELIERPGRSSGTGQLVAGFRYVGARPDLIVVFVIVFLLGAFAMNFPIFTSTMAVAFGHGAGEYGLLSSILAIGSLAGALLAARHARARLGVVIGTTGGMALAITLTALMPTFWTFALSLVLVGFTMVTVLATANGYVQTTTEPNVRGRVMALYMAVMLGGTPLGAPLVGWVADVYGPRSALLVGAAGAAVACTIGLVWAVIARDLRIVRHEQSRRRFRLSYSDVIVPSPAEFSDQVAMTVPVMLPSESPPEPEPEPQPQPEPEPDDRSR